MLKFINCWFVKYIKEYHYSQELRKAGNKLDKLLGIKNQGSPGCETIRNALRIFESCIMSEHLWYLSTYLQ